MKRLPDQINHYCGTCVVMLAMLLTFLTGSTMAQSGAQQQVTIKGTVLSASTGEPLDGVSVVDSQNPSNGTVTDAKGAYQIKVSSTTKGLSFSYLGYVTTEVLIAGRVQINVSLQK